MKPVRVATRAVLLPLDTLRMQALVLRGEVVPILTLAARENDFVSRHIFARYSLFVVRYSLFVVRYSPAVIRDRR